MKTLTFFATGIALIGGIYLLPAQPGSKSAQVTEAKGWNATQPRLGPAEAAKEAKKEGDRVRRIIKASAQRPNKAYCSSLVDAYMGTREEILAMGLDKQLESDADNDAYEAYQHVARKAGCIA